VLIEGNLLENSWVHGQVGFAVLLTPRNQDGTAPWCVVEDVALVNNIVRHCSSGVSILAEDDNHRSGRTRRLLFRNNLFCDINPGRFGGDGRLVQILSPRLPVGDMIFENNTLLHGGRGNTFICFGGEPPLVERLIFRNNVVTRGEYGIHGSLGMGEKGLQVYCREFEMTGNLIIGTGPERGMPDKNWFAPDFERAGFRDAAAGDYRLDRGQRTGTPTRAGADLDALSAATAGAVSGVWD
jgi:hypothetical protein